MSCIMQTLSLKVVKETSHKYDFNKKATCPEDVYKLIEKVTDLSNAAEEKLYMICFDTKSVATGIFLVSMGTVNSSIVHPREVYKRALITNAVSIIIVHNHPSGETSPSKEDIDITKRLAECGEILGIELLDHLIVGSNGYTSLKAKGIL
ncbi:MAG TPA: JAB domain-containing protein [Pseudoneobacillus sp.]|nr:JAB domain-containing protein [Pseudoneobacillus sp.]